MKKTALKIKRFAIRFFFRYFFFLTPWWYNLTMRFTRKRNGPPLPVISYPQDVARLIDYGNRYKPDRLGGLLDTLTHPSRIQWRLNKGKRLGDCDDHAIYWATVLLQNGLADWAYLATVQTETEKSISGHVVCVYLDVNGYWYWSDYGAPVRIAPENLSAAGAGLKAASDVSKRRLGKPIAAGLMEVHLGPKGPELETDPSKLLHLP